MDPGFRFHWGNLSVLPGGKLKKDRMKTLKARYSNSGDARPWEFMITQERLQRAGLSLPFRVNTGGRSDAMGFLDELEAAQHVEGDVAERHPAPLVALPTITPSHEEGALQIGAENKKRKRAGATKPTGVSSLDTRKKKLEASSSDKREAGRGHIQTLLKYCPPPQVARQYAPYMDKMPQSMQEIAILPVQELESAYDQLAAMMSKFVYILKEKHVYSREGLQEILHKRTEEIEILNKQLAEAHNPLRRKGKEPVQDIELPQEEEGLCLAESERDLFIARVEEMERKLKESEDARSRLEIAWSDKDNELKNSRAEVEILTTQLSSQEDTAKKHLSCLEEMKNKLTDENQEQTIKIQDLLDANDELRSKAEGLDEECRRISGLMENQKLACKSFTCEVFSKFMASEEVDRIIKRFFLRVHRHGQRVGAAKAAKHVKDCFPELDVPLIDFADDSNFRGRSGVEEFVENIPNLSSEFTTFVNSSAFEPDLIATRSHVHEKAPAAEEETAKVQTECPSNPAQT